MQRLSLRFHDSQQTGDLTMRLTADVQSIQDLIMTGVNLIATSGLRLVGMLALMFWLDWRFTLSAPSGVPPFLPFGFLSTRPIKPACRRGPQSTGTMRGPGPAVCAPIP